MSIGETKISCYLESKVAFESGPSVPQKLKIEQTLYTKEAETGEDLVKQSLGVKSVSHGNPGFYMSDSDGFEIKIKKMFYNGKYIQKRGKED